MRWNGNPSQMAKYVCFKRELEEIIWIGMDCARWVFSKVECLRDW